MHRTLIVVAAAALATSPAAAQSVNVDFGDAFGTPPADFAGAGLAGAWSAVTTPPGIAAPLVALDGTPAGVSVFRELGPHLAMDDPGTARALEALLDDGIGGVGDVVMDITFTGLRAGDYEASVYAWTPVTGAPTFILFDPDGIPGVTLGGPWPGALVEGVTHAVEVVSVGDEPLTIGVLGGLISGGFLNGIQLRRLTPADLDGNGLVGVDDLLALLATWGPCPTVCPADIDGSGDVGLYDLLFLLGDWG